MPEANGNIKEEKTGSVKKAEYSYHRGSVRISGATQVFKIGMDAYNLWARGVRPIEFVFLGANAGHQAYKCAIITCRAINRDFVTKRSRLRVACIPYWTSVVVENRETKEKIIKDCSVLRLVSVVPENHKNFRVANWRPVHKITPQEASSDKPSA